MNHPNCAMRRVFTAIRAMPTRVDPPLDPLTRRAREILALFAPGLS